MSVVIQRVENVRRIVVSGDPTEPGALHCVYSPGDRIYRRDTGECYRVTSAGIQAGDEGGGEPGEIDAADITTGVLAPERLGSGTANATTFLRGDQTYASIAGGGPHASDHESGGSDALDLGSIDGTITAEQHGTPAGDLHPSYALDADLAAHEAAADPHEVYQLESQKGAASGYASLDGATKVPIAQIPTGSSSTTVCAGDDARLSDARTPTAHTHDASDVNAGTLAIARIPTGSGSTTVCIGNDARLSDARTPVAHQHNASDVNAGTLGIARIPTGSSSSTVCIGNDARLSDARTPTAHQHNASDINAGTLATARLGSGTADSSTFLRGDQTWATPAGGGGGGGPTKLTGDSGAFAADTTWLTLTANSSDITSTTQTVVMTVTGLGAGTYRVKAALVFQAAATSTGIGITLNHTGTVSRYVANWMHVTTGGAAATGISDQATTTAAGQMMEGKAERVKDTRSSFTVGVDSANADQLAVLDAVIIVTASGDLQVKIATEVNASAVRLMAGSTLEVHKTV